MYVFHMAFDSFDNVQGVLSQSTVASRKQFLVTVPEVGFVDPSGVQCSRYNNNI